MATHDLSIDGASVGLRTCELSFFNHLMTTIKPTFFDEIPVGELEVNGTVTAYFENPALYEALVTKPHKASAWMSLRPKLGRALAYGLVAVAASLAFISGAF